MSIYNRYIIAQYAKLVAITTASLTLIVWLTQSFRYVHYLFMKGVAFDQFLLMLVFFIPNFISLVLPISGVIALCFLLFRLDIEKELTVFRAIGMNNWQISKPIALVGGCMVIFGLLMSLYGQAHTLRSFEELKSDIRKSAMRVFLQEGNFYSSKQGKNSIVFFVNEKISDHQFKGIFIHDKTDPVKDVTYTAEKGALIEDDSGAYFILQNGTQQEYNKKTEQFLIVHFDQNSVDFEEFKKNITNADNDGAQKKLSAEALYMHELLKDDGSAHYKKYKQNYMTEALHRLFIPFQALTFIFIALFILLKGEIKRQGMRLRIIFTIATIILLQLFMISIQKLSFSNMDYIYALLLLIFIPLFVSIVFIDKSYRRFFRKLGYKS